MLSVVIPTYRPRALDRVLDALGAQTNDAFEVVIVENGRFDQALATLVDSFRERLSIVHLMLPEPGLNRARNHGVRHASHDMIVLLDDDCIPGVDWVENILHSYRQFPAAGVIGGRVALSLASAAPSWLRGEFRRSLAELDWGEGCRPLRRWEHLVGANLSFTKQTFRQVGGFQNRLGLSGRDGVIRANDEAEFVLQASVVGAPGAVYSADMKVTHLIPDDRIEFTYMLRRRFGQGVSDIEQELAVLGRDAACERFASMVFRSGWHWQEHNRHAAGLGTAQALDFKLKVMQSRMSYLLGARERFFCRQPEQHRLTIASISQQRALTRGRRFAIAEQDSLTEPAIKRLSDFLYHPRAVGADPLRTTCLLAGGFENLLPVTIRVLESNEDAAA